jgi:hypothetical protein
MKLKLICIAALAAGVAGCSTSDMAYLLESGTYPDQTMPSEYITCPTGTIELQRGIRGGQAYDRAINGTRRRVMVNFQSRFGGGNQYYAGPGQATETLWRSPVDANGAGYLYQCDADS